MIPKARAVNFSRLPAEKRFVEVQRLAGLLMARVAQAVSVLPIPALAAVVHDAPAQGLSLAELRTRAEDLIRRLEAAGRWAVPGRAREHALTTALNMPVLHHRVRAQGGVYRAAEDAHEVLRYYANSVADVTEPDAAANRPVASYVEGFEMHQSYWFGACGIDAYDPSDTATKEHAFAIQRERNGSGAGVRRHLALRS